MMNFKKVVIVLCIMLLPLVFHPSIGDAAMRIIIDEDSEITFGGFVENLSGLRIGDEFPGRCAAFRNTFRPELYFRFSDTAQMFLSGNFVKEIDYTMEAGARAAGSVVEDQYDQTDFKAFELYLDKDVSSSLNIRAGRQFIVWGEADLFRLLDVVNPQDSSWVCSGIMPFEDTRVPNWAIKATKAFGYDSSLELIYLPLLDDAADRVNIGAPIGGRWSPAMFTNTQLMNNMPAYGLAALNAFTPVAFGGAGLNPATDVDMSRFGYRNIPDGNLKEGRFGGRYRTFLESPLGLIDLTFAAYYGHDLSWILKYNGSNIVNKVELDENPASPTYGTAIVHTYFQPDISMEFERQATFGLAFNFYDDILTKAVWRGELAYLPDKAFNTSDPMYPTGIEESDVFMSVIGYDKEVVLPFADIIHSDDPSTPTFISIQMYNRIVFDHSDKMRFAAYDTGIAEHETTFSVVMNTSYCNGTWKPDLTVAINANHADALIRPKLTYNAPWDENFYCILTYADFLGEKEQGFGFFKDKDSAFLQVRYMW